MLNDQLRLDHLVLTVRNIDLTVRFYTRVLGMEAVMFGEGWRALRFGNQKINLHEEGNEIEPKARVPQPGSAYLCFLTAKPLKEVIGHLASCGVAV